MIAQVFDLPAQFGQPPLEYNGRVTARFIEDGTNVSELPEFRLAFSKPIVS